MPELFWGLPKCEHITGRPPKKCFLPTNDNIRSVEGDTQSISRGSLNMDARSLIMFRESLKIHSWGSWHMFRESLTTTIICSSAFLPDPSFAEGRAGERCVLLPYRRGSHPRAWRNFNHRQP